jgi:hypothetical protein
MVSLLQSLLRWKKSKAVYWLSYRSIIEELHHTPVFSHNRIIAILNNYYVRKYAIGVLVFLCVLYGMI